MWGGRKILRPYECGYRYGYRCGYGAVTAFICGMQGNFANYEENLHT